MFFYVDWNIKMATITVIKKINRTQWDNIIIKTEKITGPIKFYWSWVRGPVLIVRTAKCPMDDFHKNKIQRSANLIVLLAHVTM
jgi:hypothetical protein